MVREQHPGASGVGIRSVSLAGGSAPARWRVGLANLLLAAVGIAAARLGFGLAHIHDGISAIAPATGIGLAAVMLGGYRLLPAIAASALASAVIAGLPAVAVVGVAAGSTAGLAASVALLRRAGFRATLERTQDVVALVALAGLIGSILSAGLGVGALAAAGRVDGSQLVSAWWVWLLGDATGVVLVGGGLLLLAAIRPSRRGAIELALALAALAGAGVLLLGYHHGFAYLIFPLLLLVAVVGRQPGAILGGLIVSSIAVAFTARGEGGFAIGGSDSNLARAQAFSLVGACAAQLLAAVLQERRSAEDAARRLADSERALAEAQRLTRIGSFELDLTTGAMTWSDELYRIFAAAREEFRPSVQAWLSRVHEDDREMVDALLAQGYDHRDSWSFQHRLVRLDGAIRTLECRGQIEFDEAGRPFRILGTGQDVTGAKMAENRIRSLFESAPYALLIIDDAGQISVVNAAAERLFGYPRDEVLGAPVEMLLPTRDSAGTWYEQPASADLVGEFGLRGRRENGSEFPIEVSISPMDNEGGPLLSVAVRDVTERKQAADALAHQASHDPLTGLPNRALFLDRLEHALARARRSHGRLAVVFVDLDDFKLVNDTRGHDVGDLLLLAIAPRLDNALRPGDTIARFGGDEFVVLCEDLAGEQAALTIAKRMADACSRPVTIAGHVHTVTVSAGVAMVEPDQVASATDLLRDADAAMYRAKAGGKGRIEMFDEGMRARLIERVAVESDLRSALERDELRLVYQPVISLRTSRIVGAEALLRWQHPERGLLEPSDFLAIAETSGLIEPIGEWVISQACRQAAVWNHEAADREPIYVSVNLSPRQVVHSEVAAHVARTLRVTGLDPALLELEITESTLLEDVEACTRIVGELKALGARIVLDDFGTSYSSLSYLKRLTIDALKIDRSFVGGLGRDTEDGAIVSAVLSIAAALEVGVTAEGVETLAQLARLRAQGCEFGQGFLFARPVTGSELGTLLGGTQRSEGVAA
jgi:diguanylate cyclase (GGDEF)-like protein/PAS domain S-box-containing protein